MSYKKYGIALILILSISPVYAAQQWRTVIAGWNNLTPETENAIPDMIRRSVASQLSQSSNFQVILAPDWTPAVTNWNAALKICRTNQADVIIYGDCYIADGKLAVFVEVFDGLESRPRLRQNYEAPIDLDLFDTIDAMVKDMVVKIREALPELSYSESVRIQEVRRSLYEQQTVTTSRLFDTQFGMNFMSFDNVINAYSCSDTGAAIITNSFTGNTGTAVPLLSFTYRYESFQFQFQFSYLSSIPSFRWSDSVPAFMSLDSSWISPSTINVFLSYYLPFWDRKFAFGIGIQGIELVTQNIDSRITNQDNGNFNKDDLPLPERLSVNLTFRPSDKLDITLAFNPVGKYKVIDTEGTSTNYLNVTTGPLQPILLDVCFYPFAKKLSPVGFELRFLYLDYHYLTVKDVGSAGPDSIEANLDSYANRTLAWGNYYSLYIGFIYKLDLM